MKLNPDFIVQQNEYETVLVPVGDASFSGIGRGNASLGLILAQLAHEVSEQDLVYTLANEYDAPIDVITGDVRRVLDQLRSIGALDE